MKTKRFAAVVASLGIIASMAAIVPMSAGAAYPVADQATGGSVKFNKYLVIPTGTAVPNVSTVFTITPVDPPVATVQDTILTFKGVEGVVFGVSEGVVPSANRKSATVSFNTNNETILDINKEDKSVELDGESNNEKFATVPVTVDFSAVKFPEPGIYCYELSETIPEGVSVVNVSGTKCIYYVNVIDTDGKLSVESYTLQNGTEAPDFETLTDNDVEPPVDYEHNKKKIDGVTNRYKSYSIEFNKVVQGNQGSRDKYFKFTVKLTNPAVGEEGHVNVSNDDIFVIDTENSEYDLAPENNLVTKYSAEEMLKANSTDIHSTTGEGAYKYVTYSELAAGKDFYLHSGQNIDILGIPEGLGYEITEVEEDYTPAVGAKSGEGMDADGVVADTKNKITDTALTANAEVTFTNTKGGVIPTGVIVSVAGSAGIVAVGAAGVACGLFMKKKKSDEE